VGLHRHLVGRPVNDHTLSSRQATAVVYLFGVTMLLVVAALFVLFHYVHEVARAEQTAERAQMTAGRAAAAAGASRCTDLQKLAAVPVPTPVAGNPSREFANQIETIWRARAHQLGCTIGVH
jgi:hypothetical protein